MEDYELEILRQFGLTEQMVRDHVSRPDYLTDAVLSFDLHQPGDGDDEPGLPPPPRGWFYHLNTKKLERDLHDLLSPCTVGYSMQLRRYGKIVFDKPWGFSKMPGERGPAGVPWTADTPMHVASVSKLITAMAMTKLLWYRNISPDALIWPYLPKYWIRGEGIDSITFRHLLTHRSGLVVPGAPGPSDFPFMKAAIAHGATGLPGYLNINYGLCRILISTIDAPYLFDLLPTTNDNYWDLTTIRHYTKYVTENIFDPAGVTSTLQHTEPNALAYPIPVTLPGYNSNDLSTMCGCVGWHLSVNDLLAIMAAFRRGNSIVDPARAQIMLDRQFGIDQVLDPPLGRIYAKGGFWGNGSSVEQCNVFFLPKGMELAILANSPFCKPGNNFMGNVLDVIQKNIESNLFTLTVTAMSVLAALAVIRKSRAVVKRP